MRKYISIIVLVLISFIVFSAKVDVNLQMSKRIIEIVRWIDGDSCVIQYGGEEERLRLSGVDTPESVHPTKPVQPFAIEASNHVKEKFPVGTVCFLEFDEKERDFFGRLLGYLHTSDGVFINYYLVRNGYGIAYTKYKFKYKEMFVHAEELAKEEGLGMWALEVYNDDN